MSHDRFMALALALGRRAQGRTWPNPAVGCVLVRDGQVVGRGWTADGGRPHAEPQALQQAGGKARGATAYVTLEPCAMCAGALAHARVAKVIYGAPDPKSGGVEHGAKVFLHSQSHHRPEVIGGISEVACSTLMSEFFSKRRSKDC